MHRIPAGWAIAVAGLLAATGCSTDTPASSPSRVESTSPSDAAVKLAGSTTPQPLEGDTEPFLSSECSVVQAVEDFRDKGPRGATPEEALQAAVDDPGSFDPLPSDSEEVARFGQYGDRKLMVIVEVGKYPKDWVVESIIRCA